MSYKDRLTVLMSTIVKQDIKTTPYCGKWINGQTRSRLQHPHSYLITESSMILHISSLIRLVVPRYILIIRRPPLPICISYYTLLIHSPCLLHPAVFSCTSIRLKRYRRQWVHRRSPCHRDTSKYRSHQDEERDGSMGNRSTLPHTIVAYTDILLRHTRCQKTA